MPETTLQEIMSDDIQGQCLCGETIITVADGSNYKDQVLCHCWDCKQSSGSAFSSNIIVPVKDLKIEGPTKEFKIKVPSGNIVTRVFCGNCGSAICHASPAFGDAKAVQTGNFRYFADKPVALELWTKDRWTALQEIPGAKQSLT